MGRAPEVTRLIPYFLNPWWGTVALVIGGLLSITQPANRVVTRIVPTVTPSASERYVPPTSPGTVPTMPDTLLFSRKCEGRTKDDLREAWYRVYREVGPPPTVDALPIVTPQGVCSWQVENRGN